MEDEDEIEIDHERPPLLNLSMFQYENKETKLQPVRAISRLRQKSKFYEQNTIDKGKTDELIDS